MVIDTSSLSIKKLDDTVNCSQFNCKSEDVQNFLIDTAKDFRNEMLGMTYCVFHDTKMVAFFTISMDGLRIQNMEVDDQIGRKNIEYYPAIKIGQLGVDLDHEGEGIGSYILKLIYGIGGQLSDHIGCRFIVVNSLPSACSWYETRGFTPLKSQKGRNKPIYYLDILKLS